MLWWGIKMYCKLITEADYAQLERITKLVEGVEFEDIDDISNDLEDKMDYIESQEILCRALGNELLSYIQQLSESDIDALIGDSVFQSFLESNWEIRDFELLLDLTGNLDAPR